MTDEKTLNCPHCGAMFSRREVQKNKFCAGLIPSHPYLSWRTMTMITCPGSNQSPRNAEADRRPLWKDGCS